MTAHTSTHGFPQGYFIIVSRANGRVWDVRLDRTEDGTEIILFPEKESLRRDHVSRQDASNQIFFIDNTGALCSKSAGHAIDVNNQAQLVLRHRRPEVPPYPNEFSHPLPVFSYSAETGQISMTFSTDPSYPSNPTSNKWREVSFLVSSIPMPKNKHHSTTGDFAEYMKAAVSIFSTPHSPRGTHDDIVKNNIELLDDEVLEEDRNDEVLDDSPEGNRYMHVQALNPNDVWNASQKIKERREFEVVPVVFHDRARTATMAGDHPENHFNRRSTFGP